jgi:hypothetical protein
MLWLGRDAIWERTPPEVPSPLPQAKVLARGRPLRDGRRRPRNYHWANHWVEMRERGVLSRISGRHVHASSTGLELCRRWGRRALRWGAAASPSGSGMTALESYRRTLFIRSFDCFYSLAMRFAQLCRRIRAWCGGFSVLARIWLTYTRAFLA